MIYLTVMVFSPQDVYSLQLESNAKSDYPALVDKILAELQCMKDNGIIWEVEGPMDWSSPMMIIYKKNGGIQLCTSFRTLTKYVKCEQFQLPIFKEVTCWASGFWIFSMLDYQSGYWQIPVVESSQLLLTFSMPFGRYWYQRLPFGLLSASEIFQSALSQLLHGMQGAHCYLDDILVFTKNLPEYNAVLDLVLT